MSASKRKGTAWETQVVDYLREHGQPYAERRALSGSSDKGDIAGVPGVMIECKNEAKVTLGAYADEVKAQTAHAGASIGVAVVKRRSRGPGDAYVVMTLEQFAAILADPENLNTGGDAALRQGATRVV
jgi:Holliday junction resolvase